MQSTCLKPECLAEHGRSEYKKQKEKEEVKKKREHREWKKATKEKLKSHGEYESELETTIREISALLDASMNYCISCGSLISNTNKANAGHRFAVGTNNTLRFNLDNIHRQGVCCNKWKSGNLDKYDEGLIKMYGKDYYEFVKFELKRNYPIVKLTIPELVSKRAIALKVKSDLKKKEGLYTASERLSLREEINKQIGIYEFGYSDYLSSVK